MILNIKQLNKSIEYHHFKMDTLLTALAMVKPGDWFISIDFSDAYYSIPVASSSRKWLRFMFEGRLLEFNAVANGLTTGPRLFTKVLKVPLTVLRQFHGIRIVGYLDDTLVAAATRSLATSDGLTAAEMFVDLGYTINLKKSHLLA